MEEISQTSGPDKTIQRKEKIKNWLKDPYNLSFICILSVIFIIRLYYFFLTLNQPLWWDEAGYMSTAKGYAGIVDYELESVRAPGFPFLMSLFFRFGISNESLMRFIALFLPSILLILLTYFCIKEMYPDKKIALISMALIGVLWEHLFYSNRFHTENFSLIFQFLAFYIFFKCYINKNNFVFIKPKFSLVYVFLLSIVSVLFRPSNAVFLPVLPLFIAIYNIPEISKHKLRSFLILIISILICLIAYYNLKFIHDTLIPYFAPRVFSLEPFMIFYYFYQSIIPNIPSFLLYSFILGFIIALTEILLAMDFMKDVKSCNNLRLNSNLFNLILILSVLSAFLFLRRGGDYEFRWFFPLILGMFVFTAQGFIIFGKFINKIIKKREIVFAIVGIILVLGIYSQIYHADNIIRLKLDSYSQIKDAALWMRENSLENEAILSVSLTQTIFYSERHVYTYARMNQSDFIDLVQKTNPRYLEVSVLEPNHPDWIYEWPTLNNETVRPVKVYYLDSDQKQPVLIVYEFIKPQESL